MTPGNSAARLAAAILRRRRGGLSGLGGGRAAVPWFRAHPEAAAAVITVSSVAVLILQIVDRRASDAFSLLYVLPISLAAMTFGAGGGLVAAAVAYTAFALFAIFSSVAHVEVEGWVGRAAAMFLLGGLLGRASDQTERAAEAALAHHSQRLIAEEKRRRYAEGIELSDSILQHVAAAKWAIEQGDSERATQLLGQALSSGQEMVGDLLPTRSVPAAPPTRESNDRPHDIQARATIRSNVSHADPGSGLAAAEA